MKKYDITVKGKPYTDKKTGQEKNSYRNVGTLTQGISQKNGEPYTILELHMFPFTEFSVFEQKPRDAKPQAEKTIDYGADGGYAKVENENVNGFDYGESLNPADIPF